MWGEYELVGRVGMSIVVMVVGWAGTCVCGGGG